MILLGFSDSQLLFGCVQKLQTAIKQPILEYPTLFSPVLVEVSFHQIIGFSSSIANLVSISELPLLFCIQTQQLHELPTLWIVSPHLTIYSDCYQTSIHYLYQYVQFSRVPLIGSSSSGALSWIKCRDTFYSYQSISFPRGKVAIRFGSIIWHKMGLRE